MCATDGSQGELRDRADVSSFPRGSERSTVRSMTVEGPETSGTNGGVSRAAMGEAPPRIDHNLLQDSDETEPELILGHDILVVDDNETNLIAIEAALAQLG